MKIWIDADAAPKEAKEIVFRATLRLQIETVLVANSPLRTPVGNSRVSFVLVPGGPDVADKHILEQAATTDVVITADIPLAAALVAKGVAVIDPRGVLHHEDNIGERLAGRHLMDQLRGSGLVTGGPSPYNAKDRHAFASTLDQVLTRLTRKSPTR